MGQLFKTFSFFCTKTNIKCHKRQSLIKLGDFEEISNLICSCQDNEWGVFRPVKMRGNLENSDVLLRPQYSIWKLRKLPTPWKKGCWQLGPNLDMISQFIIAQLVKAQASFDEDDGVKIDDFLLDSIILDQWTTQLNSQVELLKNYS